MNEANLRELYEKAQAARRKAEKSHDDAIAGDADNLREQAEADEQLAFEAERDYLVAMFTILKATKPTKWMTKEDE